MDTQKLWQLVLNEIELQVSRAVYKTIFAQTSLVDLTQTTAVIGCSNPLLINIIEKRYSSLIKNTLDTLSKGNVTLSFVAKQTPSKKPLSGPLFNQIKSERSIFDIKRYARLNPNLNFENYAVSSSNQMAYAATQAVANSPGSSYNPLFLYGGVGVGKTHLMQSIGNVLVEKNPKTRVIFTMGEEFTNEIIEAIRNKTTDVFKKKYRSADLLLLDDIQFIAGKNTVQEEFFYTFNAIAQSGVQIVMTSDKPPHEIARLEDRLRSRFEGGLIIDISPPDFELRAAIVHIKSNALRLSVPADAAQIIAANVADARAIEGFLRRLTSEVATKSQPITPELVSSLLNTKTLSGSRGNNPSRRVSQAEILAAVSSYFDIKTTVLKGPKRDR